jgi:hypothetical protein
VILAAIALILARSHESRDVPPAPVIQKDEPTWKYSLFEFGDGRTTESGRTLYAHLVFYDFKADKPFESEPTQTNRLIDAEELLNKIGEDGWQFVWTNGTNFITRRATGQGKHAYFTIHYSPENQ